MRLYREHYTDKKTVNAKRLKSGMLIFLIIIAAGTGYLDSQKNVRHKHWQITSRLLCPAKWQASSRA